MKKHLQLIILIVLAIAATVLCGIFVEFGNLKPQPDPLKEKSYKTVNDVPEFDYKPYVVINENRPDFSKEEIIDNSYVSYLPLDEYKRPQGAVACIGADIMPTKERGNVSAKPYGSDIIKSKKADGKTVYNNCHIIGYQLTGENRNICNFMLGTTYFNNNGMLPFENMIADYVKETDNHVLYRVTVMHTNNNLLADGVQLEAMSVEDDGEGICFNVYVYNAYPDVKIDYKNGDIITR